MILEKGNKKTIEKNNETPKVHVKTASQDLSNSSNHSNIYITKLINQNNIKNETLINDSLPNLKKNIQNIFANEEKKEKAFRYLIRKNKDYSTNSRDRKNIIKTPVIKPYRKTEIQSKRVISPYNNKNFYSFKPIVSNYDMTKSYASLREPNYIGNNDINNTIYRYSVNTQKYISEDEPFNQNDFYKENHFWLNDNNTYTNLINNNKNININRNRGNKFEHIAIYNTYNNTFNNYRMQKNNKVRKNIINQTYDYGNQNNLRNILNKNDKSSIEQNPYKDYMKCSNLSNIKKTILDDDKKNIIIDISDNENNIKDKEIKKNNYVKRVKNYRIKVQKNEILTMKKNPKKMNDSTISNKPNSNYYYVHKNLGHKILYQKKNEKKDLNPNSNAIKIEDNYNNIEDNKNINPDNIDRKANNNINNSNNKTYEKRKNYYDIYGHKDIQINSLDNKKKYENENKNDDDKKIAFNVSTIKVNIDKNILKDYCNSPLSTRYNKYFIDNRNKLFNKNKIKKTYEKRETTQRSPKVNYINNQFDNYKNKDQISVDAKTDINATNTNNLKNKYVFNDDEEIIEFIKKKYNKRNIEEIINKGNSNINNAIYEPKKEKKYIGLMTTEEGKKIKQKNEELSTEIKNLKFENKQYKKELNDMKSRFNDLSKEISTIKESK